MNTRLIYAALLLNLLTHFQVAKATANPEALTANQNQQFFGQSETPFWLKPTLKNTKLLRKIYGVTDLQRKSLQLGDGTKAGPYLGKGVRGQCGEAFRSSHTGFSHKPINSESLEDQYNWQKGTAGCGIAFANNKLLKGASGLLPQGRAYIQKKNFSAQIKRHKSSERALNFYQPSLPVLTIGNYGRSETRGNYAALNIPVDQGIHFFRDNAVMLYANADGSAQRIAPFLQSHASLDLELLEVFYSGYENQQISAKNSRAGLKNALISGVVCLKNTAKFNDDSYCMGNYGPTAEGRIKPDLVLGKAEHISLSHHGGQQLDKLGGLPGSTFQLMGLAGLVNQMYSDGIFTGKPRQLGNLALLNEAQAAARVYRHRPSPSMTKALLVNSAYRYPVLQIDRYAQGWGIPQLGELAKRAVAGKGSLPIVTDRKALISGQIHQQTIFVHQLQETGKLEITMVFHDPENDPVTPTNNLSLRVTSPSGAIYWGNQGLLYGDASVSGTVEDMVNTIEHVSIPEPETGGWKLEVIASSIEVDGVKETPEIDNRFALVASCTADTLANYNFCSNSQEQPAPVVQTATSSKVFYVPTVANKRVRSGIGSNNLWAILALLVILLFYRLYPKARGN